MRWLVLPLAALLSACAVVTSPRSVPWDEAPPPDQRARLVEDAREFSRTRAFEVGGRRFPFDCSGYVAAVLYRNGIDVYGGASELQIRGNGVRLLHQYILRYGTLFDRDTPEPGDLVFFSNTYDRNRDRKANDAFTHVGIVEKVDRDGTVTFLHLMREEVQRGILNLSSPGDTTVNSYLRRRTRKGPKGIPVLTGGLFAGYGSIVKG